MGLMSVMSEWVQANTSILRSITCCICSFSTPDRRELTLVDLSGSVSDIDSKGSTTNRSLSSSASGRQSVVAILRFGSQGSNYGSFRFSHAPALTIGSTAGLLVGCLGDQLAHNWSDS